MTAPQPTQTPSLAGARLAGPGPAGLQRALIALALGGLVFGALGLRRGSEVQFMAAYLVSFLFYLTLSLGGLFFVLLHHLTGARWSIVLRRLAESLALMLILMFLLFLPMLGWLPFLYPWAGKIADPVLLKKTAWLNPPLFALRAFVYFGVWIALANGLYQRSRRQDAGDPNAMLVHSMRRISAPGMLLFAITITFASFDWIMSLDAHWYSTVLGVYVFSGAAVAVYAAMILIALALRAAGWLGGIVTVEHFHDLGKILFAFVIFWAYIAFSQMMLIWYGNLPEETAWYAQRWHPPFWKGVSLLLLAGHFLLPFLFLLPRTVKRMPPLLGLAAAWLLLMHAVDCAWLVLPTLPKIGAPRPTDLFLFAGMGFLYAAVLIGVLQRHPLVPAGDPRLGESIAFENR